MTMVARHAAVALTVALIIALGPARLAAQTDESFDKIYPFIGYWDTDIGLRGQDRGNCGGRRGDAGEKLNNCSIPVDVLPLNARAEAWLKYMDARQSPALSECAQVSIPGVLGSGVYISGYPGRMVLYHPDPSGHVTRNVCCQDALIALQKRKVYCAFKASVRSAVRKTGALPPYSLIHP